MNQLHKTINFTKLRLAYQVILDEYDYIKYACVYIFVYILSGGNEKLNVGKVYSKVFHQGVIS